MRVQLCAFPKEHEFGPLSVSCLPLVLCNHLEVKKFELGNSDSGFYRNAASDMKGGHQLLNATILGQSTCARQTINVPYTSARDFLKVNK